MDNDVEVIFESWLYKLRGDGTRQFGHIGSAWRKKYFVLIRDCNKPCLLYFNNKPDLSCDVPRGTVTLAEHYRVERKPKLKGKELVCRLTTQTRVLFLASDKEHVHHLLMFFLTTQIRLKEHLESECFVVRTENSEDHRQIGSRGAMCLLHVSKFGLTLALQASRCVLAQWPLRCIRSYECTGRGRFTMESGSHADHGAGVYVLHTRIGQDAILYDKIDGLVNELASLQGMVSAGVSSLSLTSIESLAVDYHGLSQLTFVHSDSSSISQLKRISRDIFDHLAEHLGSASRHVYGSAAISLSDIASTSSNTSPHLATTPSRFQHEEAASASANLGSGVPLTSQYLHVAETTNDEQHVPPPLAVFSHKSSSTAATKPSPGRVRLHHMYSVERETSDPGGASGTSVELTDSFDRHSYENATALGNSWDQRSVGNVSDYARMSGESSTTGTSFSPQRFDSAREPDGQYSYAQKFELFPLPQPNGDVLDCGARPKLSKTSSIPDMMDANSGTTSAPKNIPSSFVKSAKTKLVKTSSSPTVLEESPSRISTGGDDYVPASPPGSAAVSVHMSGSGLGGARMSDPMSPSTPASDTSGSQSPAVVSLVAGVSMSSRSRVFTRQK